MVNTMSTLLNDRMNHLETSFAELQVACKRARKVQPAYERWKYKALDAIATHGGYIAAFGVVASIGYMATPLLFGSLALGALTLTAYGIKKFLFDSKILYMNLPEHRSGWFTNRDFFDDLDNRLNITLGKFAGKLSVSRQNVCDKLNSKLIRLDNYVQNLEKNHALFVNFNPDRIANLKCTLEDVRISVTVLRALNSLKNNEKNYFAAWIKDVQTWANSSKRATELGKSLTKIQAQFDKARTALQDHEDDNGESLAVDALETISKGL